MARLLYGLGSGDYVSDGSGVIQPGTTVTVWSHRVGGSQITDLLGVTDVTTVNGSGVVTALTGVVGFYGPDGYTGELWAQAGAGPRVRLLAPVLGALADRVDALATEVVVADPAQYAIDPTGVSSSTAGLQAAVDDAPDGARLRIPGGGTYLLNGPLQVVDKSLVIDATGARLVGSGSDAVVEASATVDALHPVSSLTATTITEDTVLPGTVIAFTNASLNTGWVRGDTIKVISDDVIPGALTGAGTSQPRTGEYFTVHSASAGSVTVYGTPYDPLTTNVRAARMKSEHKVTVINGHYAGGGGLGVLVFKNLVAPEVVGVSVGSTGGTGVAFQGCVNHRADLNVEYAPNDPGADKYGYGVNSVSSAYGRVSIRALRARHAYTTNTNGRAAGSADLWAYGRTFSDVVSGIATDTSSSAWDTHSDAAEVVFDGVVAHRCYAAVALRGRHHKVRNAVGSDAHLLLWVFSHDGTADSWGHEVDGLSGRAIRSTNGAVYVSGPTVRETRPITIRNVHVDGHTGPLLYAARATVAFDNVSGVAAATQANNTAALRVTDAVVDGSGLRADIRGVTSGTGLRYVQVSPDSSVVRLSGRNEWKFASGAGNVQAILSRGSATELAQITGLEMDYLPTARVVGSSPSNQLYSADGFLEWKVRQAVNRGTSDEVMLTDAQLADTTQLSALAHTRAGQVMLVAYCTAARTVGTLPAGRYYGQGLTIVTPDGNGANVLTVPHDPTTAKIKTVSGADVSLGKGEAIELVWTGTYWTQRK